MIVYYGCCLNGRCERYNARRCSSSGTIAFHKAEKRRNKMGWFTARSDKNGASGGEPDAPFGPTCEGSILTPCDLIPEGCATATDHRTDERAFLAAHRRTDTGTDTR
jgi:hypothetical protein